ncbi:hypothetical protein EZV62_026492 [Acer yangbiense]|uniref:Uncharacterized protein n=1 Tax=Acer yangbiense TaxID=1000413 RepID=A0A5C7GR85_9ROSI|nr:hypothetical protein EZV62_026492 [Acer yangbiense]
MAASSNATLHVPQFSGENYQIWTVKMKSYMKAFGLWDYVNEDNQVPPLRANPTIAQMKQHEEEKMKRDKAVTCLYSALSDSVFTSIMHLDTAKLIWDELKERFEGNERVRSVKLLTLKREFEMLRMKEGETFKDYSSKLSELVNQMRLYGDTIEDHKVVEKMLVSLPDKFEAKVSAIEESCDLKALTVSEMVSKLQAQEQRLAIKNGDEMEGAFQARHKGNQPFKKDQKKQGSGPRNGDKKGKAKLDSSSAEAGARNKAKQNQQTKQPAQQANFTDEQTPDDHLFMVTQVCNVASNEVWYVDSGCTSHMAKDESLFSSLNRTDRTRVKLGNGNVVQAAGRGNVLIHTNSGTKVIHDVLLIPDLDQNLLSVAQLLKRGYSLSFKDDCCVIVDCHDVEVARIKMLVSSKGYKVYNVQTKKILVSRDVQFDEGAHWNWENKQVQRDSKEIQLEMKPIQAEQNDQNSHDDVEVDDDLIAEFDSPVLKTKSLAEIYERWSLDDSKSTTGYIFSLGSGALSWNSKKQEVLADLNFIQAKPTVLWCDNISAISMAKNHVLHGRTKHINVKFHVIREAERDGEVKLVHCKTEEQVADILTKALGYGQFNVLRAKLGVSKKNFKEEC